MVLHYTLFQGNEFGNGAYRRSFQITSLLESLDEKVLTISQYPVEKNDTSFYERLKLAYRYLKFIDFSKVSLHKLRYKVLDIVLWKKYLQTLKKSNENLIVVYDLTYYSDDSLIFACQDLGIEIIGILHNIESLVHNQKSLKSDQLAPNWFLEEIKLLRNFSSIFTISREEQWLLNLYHINATYLPYVPSKNVRDTCLKVRSLRKDVVKSFYLTIGTASNQPTIDGFKELITIFETLKLKDKLLIAGYDTDKLASYLNDKDANIRLLGSLNDQQLEDALINCKAILIHQKPTTGALTKIPELLLSGIPVLCNTASARNYYYHKGLYVYDTAKELESLLNDPKILSNFDFILENKNEVLLRKIQYYNA